jgi:predicted transcriptional regulator
LRITIPLSEDTGDALRQLASRECRDPRMQAKFLLERAIRTCDGLPKEGAADLTTYPTPATAAP